MAKANSCVPQHELEIALGEPGCVVLDCDAIRGLIELHQSNSVDVANMVKRCQFTLADGRLVRENCF